MRVLAATVFAALVLIPAAGTHGIREGGTFRVGVAGGFSAIDPAINPQFLLRPACASLLNTPPERYPSGLRFEPELAEEYPAVSKDGRTYTFTIRRDAQFSNGAPVLARDVVHTLERVLTLGPEATFLTEQLSDIVGAKAMLDKTATNLSGATARGRTLILKLRTRVRDLPVRVSQQICVVPASLPADLEGVKAPIPSPAPYYIAEHVPDRRIVLARNRHYTGARPHHPARFVLEMSIEPATIVERVKRGDLELAGLGGPSWAPFVGELRRRYGVNKSQFFSAPGQFLRMFVLNTSRPLFKNNVKLRQAVNFAVDRQALIREFGPAAGRPTDQFLPPVLPGFRNEAIYPLKRPDLAMARKLAAGRTRSGKAVLYVPANPVGSAQAEILKGALVRIGLEVEVKQLPPPLLFEKLATPGEPFDIGWIGWLMSPDFLGTLFDGRTVGQPASRNWSYFDSPKYNRLIAANEALPFGRAREHADGELDVLLSRDAAPGIPYGVSNELSFVSANVGCIVLNPGVDITAVCLK